MNFPDMYRKFAYKVRLKLTSNPEKIKNIIEDQLPFLIENYRKDELSEVENFLITASGSLGLKDFRSDFYEKIINHSINNNNTEMFRQFKTGILEIKKNTKAILIEKGNFELIKIYCESPYRCDQLMEELRENLHNAAKEKNYIELDKIFKFESDFKHYVESLPLPRPNVSDYSTDSFKDIIAHETTLKFANNIKETLGTQLLNEALYEHSKELVNYATNIGRYKVKGYVVSHLIEDNQLELLKTVLIHPNIDIDHLKRDPQTSVHPDNIFILASRVGAVDLMKFAVEFNGEAPEKKILENSLKFCVNKGSKEGIDYLLTEFKEHYNIELLEDITSVLVEQKRVEIAAYLKEKCPDIKVEIEDNSKKVENKLGTKINRLRESSFNLNSNNTTLNIN